MYEEIKQAVIDSKKNDLNELWTQEKNGWSFKFSGPDQLVSAKQATSLTHI